MDVIRVLVESLSYRVVLVCLMSVPLTNLLGLTMYCGRPAGQQQHGAWAARCLVFPFTGGNRHVIFQLCSWVLWALSATVMLPVYLPHRGTSLPIIPHTHVDVISGSAAVASFIAELFMLKALLVYDGTAAVSNPKAPAKGLDAKSHRTGASQLMVSPALAVALVHVMGAALALTGALLLLSLEFLPDLPSRVLYCCLALSCLTISASSTYGLGGHLRYNKPYRRKYSSRSNSSSSEYSTSGDDAVVNGKLAEDGSETRFGVSAQQLEYMHHGTAITNSNNSKSELENTWQNKAAVAPTADAAGSSKRMAAVRGTIGDASCGLPHPQQQEEEQQHHQQQQKQDDEVDGSWRFFQPFAGGTAFVSTQAIGWTLFSFSVVGVAELARRLLLGLTHAVRGWAISTGLLMCTTQLVLGLSLLTYRGRTRAARFLVKPLLHPRDSWRMLCAAISLPMPVVLMYMPIHLFFASWSLAFAFLPLHVAVACLACALVPYYIITLRGEPAHTACRQWPWLQRWFSHYVEASLKWWCGGLQIIAEGEEEDEVVAEGHEDELASKGARANGPTAQSDSPATITAAKRSSTHSTQQTKDSTSDSTKGSSKDSTNLSKDGRYVFGLHPHGYYPAGAGFLPLCPSLAKALPQARRPTTLTASVVHYVPGVRDIAMWAGFRQVSRATFRLALSESGSVMLCPGGQAELVYADRCTAKNGEAEMVIYAGHRGFVREALSMGASLVPVLAIGETLTMRNAWHWQSLLRYTYKRLGFPFPLLLAGRWGITTLPLPSQLIYVVGRPIPPPPACRDLAPGQAVPEELVRDMHQQFYAAMERMWHKHHAKHPQLAHARLRVVWSDK